MTNDTEATENRQVSEKPAFPRHGWLGLVLVAVFWTLNWTLPGLRTHWGFFPMWLGYCLTVDGLVFMRKGNSLLTRDPKAYALMFLISMPGWWLFELFNLRLQNWVYLGMEEFSNLEYFLLSSLSFSTVMPAVFGTAELAGTFLWIRNLPKGPQISPNTRNLNLFGIIGFGMLCLMLIWPRYFFPCVWLSVFCMLEPWNHRSGHRTLFESTDRGDWRPLVALWAGCLICGFFWEFWNFWSYPKWIYQIPFVDFWRIFEMPVLGYLGYLPFALELFGLYHLVTGIFPGMGKRDYLQIIPVHKDSP